MSTLAENGVGVVELTAQTKNLEEIFLSLTQTNGRWPEMLRSFHAELQKAHRRHDLLLCLLVPLIMILWVGGLAPSDPGELANGYSALLYSIPVIEAIPMPVLMAVLASRLWAIEVCACSSAQSSLHPAMLQPASRQSRLWPAGNSAGDSAGNGSRRSAGHHARLHGSLSHWAAGLSVRLHTGCGRNALLWRISADAVGGQSPAGALRASKGHWWGCSLLLCRRLPVILCPLGTTSR